MLFGTYKYKSTPPLWFITCGFGLFTTPEPDEPEGHLRVLQLNIDSTVFGRAARDATGSARPLDIGRDRVLRAWRNGRE